MRQIILLCDGTNNNLTAGRADTHVVRLAEWLGDHPDPRGQRIVYYDPGVGNPGVMPQATPWENLKRRFQRLKGLAVGAGVFENIAEGYRFIMRQWYATPTAHKESELWFFGFSRGAFTARSIAGLVNRFGVLEPQYETMVPTLVHLYFSSQAEHSIEAYKDLSRQARDLLTRDDPRPRIHFVGVWDTVEAVGLPGLSKRISAKSVAAGKWFVHVRHALALDEQRRQFLPRIYEDANGPFKLRDGSAGDIVQLWFRGAHCDIGGGYGPEDSELGWAPLGWMVHQALLCGLRAQGLGPTQTEDEVRTSLIACIQAKHPAFKVSAPALIHSEIHSMPLWAATGLTVRSTLSPPAAGRPRPEHSSVEAWTPRLPQDTVWARPLGGWPLWLLCLGVLMLPVLIGMLQSGVWPSWGGASPWDAAQAALRANLDFQEWQLGVLREALFNGRWLGGVAVLAGLAPFANPGWALLLDLVFMAFYLGLLSRWNATAYAAAAGVQRWGHRAPSLLVGPGRLLMGSLVADLAENSASFAVIGLGAAGQPALAGAAALIVAVASVAKWIGLLACLGCCVVWMLLGRHRA